MIKKLFYFFAFSKLIRKRFCKLNLYYLFISLILIIIDIERCAIWPKNRDSLKFLSKSMTITTAYLTNNNKLIHPIWQGTYFCYIDHILEEMKNQTSINPSTTKLSSILIIILAGQLSANSNFSFTEENCRHSMKIQKWTLKEILIFIASMISIGLWNRLWYLSYQLRNLTSNTDKNCWQRANKRQRLDYRTQYFKRVYKMLNNKKSYWIIKTST